MVKFVWFLCLITVLPSADTFAQNGEKGLPFFEYYTPTDYKAGNFNYNIIKDIAGVYYFSNKDGVLMYNGLDWSLVKIKKDKPIYWLQQGSDSIIYVGSTGELGYLNFAENGAINYVSLMDKIAPEYHDFGPVWEIATTSREVVFRSKKHIFVLKDGNIDVIHPSSRHFDIAFTVRDTVFIRESGVGIGYVSGGIVNPIKGGDYFSMTKTNMFLPFGDDQMIVATRHHGLYLLSPSGDVVPFETEADDFLKKYKIYHGCITYDGNYAFAAYNKGVVVVSPTGKLIESFDASKGMTDFQYLFVGVFDANNLWIANGVGVSRVEILSPLTYFDHRSNIQDVANDIIRFDGDIYLSTLRSLYKLSSVGKRNYFKKLEPIGNNEYYSLQELNGKLLVGSDEGLQLYQDGRFVRKDSQWIHYAKVIEDEVWIGIAEGGIGQYVDFENSTELLTLDGFFETVKNIVPLGDRVVMVSDYGDVFIISKVRNENESKRSLRVDAHFEIEVRELVTIGRQVIAFTDTDFYLIDQDGSLSEPFPFHLSAPEITIECVTQIEGNQLWISYHDPLRNHSSEQVWFSDSVISVTGIGFNSDYTINSIYSDLDSVSWFVGDGGTIRYDRKIAPIKSIEKFECHIASLTWQQDSLIFENGYGMNDFLVPYDSTDLRFSYYTNEIQSSSQTMYQYYMVGRDDGWSEWSYEWRKDYTNLPAGKYIFHVRAKNVINQISEVDAFTFEVVGPWYLSRELIAIYVVLFILLTYFIYRVRTNKLKDDKLQLGYLVSERTIEVEEQKKNLEIQREVLQNMNDTKNQLFSIIGHDLRSPLNSIQSLTELIQHYHVEKKPELVDDMMQHLSGSVKGLRHLLDNLLTWALNQSGNFKLKPELIRLDPFFKETVSILLETANAKNIEIKLMQTSDCLLYADRNSMSTVMRNLISNAIKFSHEGGIITIHYYCDNENTSIEIVDEGVGIQENKRNEIYQLTSTTFGTNNEKGTGLGLVLVSEFVSLNGGTINVQSKEGKGTTFTLQFPNK